MNWPFDSNRYATPHEIYKNEGLVAANELLRRRIWTQNTYDVFMESLNDSPNALDALKIKVLPETIIKDEPLIHGYPIKVDGLYGKVRIIFGLESEPIEWKTPSKISSTIQGFGNRFDIKVDAEHLYKGALRLTFKKAIEDSSEAEFELIIEDDSDSITFRTIHPPSLIINSFKDLFKDEDGLGLINRSPRFNFTPDKKMLDDATDSLIKRKEFTELLKEKTFARNIREVDSAVIEKIKGHIVGQKDTYFTDDQEEEVVTKGVEPCVVVISYGKGRNGNIARAITHMDDGQSAEEILSRQKNGLIEKYGIDKTKLKSRLVGGWITSPDLQMRLVEELIRQQVDIDEVRLSVTNEGSSINVVIKPDAGVVYSELVHEIG
ncbi:hypothetical protein JW796_02195 [Candidatus Dojkabacteria bacterium]|nr:hypothetical protein [Candidatus Dojkabacteria bacterium]